MGRLKSNSNRNFESNIPDNEVPGTVNESDNSEFASAIIAIGMTMAALPAKNNLLWRRLKLGEEMERLAEIEAARRVRSWATVMSSPWNVGMLLLVLGGTGIVVALATDENWVALGFAVLFIGFIVWLLRRGYIRWERQKYGQFYAEELLAIRSQSMPVKKKSRTKDGK